LDRGGEHGKRLATLLRSEPVRRVSSVIDPMILEPYPPTSRRVVLAASNDRLTSMRAAQRLHERWQGEVAWHAGGHIGHLMSSGARSVVDDFLLSDNEVRSPEVP
jgi:predicted alpha/beta hydrolase family esterase